MAKTQARNIILNFVLFAAFAVLQSDSVKISQKVAFNYLFLLLTVVALTDVNQQENF